METTRTRGALAAVLSVLAVAVLSGCSLLGIGGDTLTGSEFLYEFEDGSQIQVAFTGDGEAALQSRNSADEDWFDDDPSATYTREGDVITLSGDGDTFDFVLDGDTLTLTIDGESYVFTKQ